MESTSFPCECRAEDAFPSSDFTVLFFLDPMTINKNASFEVFIAPKAHFRPVAALP